MMVQTAIFLVFPLCVTLAAFTDFLEMTVPNRIPIVLAGAFFVLAPITSVGWADLGLHVAAAFAVFSACFALFAFGVMGGGDAKLLTAAALWFGLDTSLLTFILYVAYLGGILTILILLVRSCANSVLAMGLPIPNSIVMAKKIPYAIAIGAAGLLSFPQSPLLLWALNAAG